MSKSLVLVESQKKYQTLQCYLNQSELYQLQVVESDPATIRSLYWGQFQPHRENPALASLAENIEHWQTIYIATAPGPLGGFWARHWQRMLGLPESQMKRVSWPFLSNNVVLSSLKPGSSDIDSVLEQLLQVDMLVDSHVRKVLHPRDNVPILGMVPLIALNWIAEQSSEPSKTQLEIVARFRGRKEWLEARLCSQEGQPLRLTDRNVAKATIIDLKEHTYHISKINNGQTFQEPPQPFNTAALLSTAQAFLGFSFKTTLDIALFLYDGVDIGLKMPLGLISFPLTDSTVLPPEEITGIREFILVNFGTMYLPQTVKKSDFDASTLGAIRPAQPLCPPRKIKKYLTKEQYALYKLIWARTLASQMNGCLMGSRIIELSGGPEQRYQFKVQ